MPALITDENSPKAKRSLRDNAANLFRCGR